MEVTLIESDAQDQVQPDPALLARNPEPSLRYQYFHASTRILKVRLATRLGSSNEKFAAEFYGIDTLSSSENHSWR